MVGRWGSWWVGFAVSPPFGSRQKGLFARVRLSAKTIFIKIIIKNNKKMQKKFKN
jgi:hypothetical protein